MLTMYDVMAYHLIVKRCELYGFSAIQNNNNNYYYSFLSRVRISVRLSKFSWRRQIEPNGEKATTVVPALGDPRRERPPAVYGHFVNVPTHVNVKLPVISGHLPNADADSHLLVVSTCYNGQCKQMPRFRWSFQPKIACAHTNLRPSVLSNVRAVVW